MTPQQLTRAEEQVMQYVWEIKRCCLKDIVAKFPEPRPAYTTISTVVRVLVKKKFIGFKTVGKTNEYYPLITKGEYFTRRVKPMLTKYLNGSAAAIVSYFSNEKLSLSELEEIKKLVEERIKKLKTKKNN